MHSSYPQMLQLNTFASFRNLILQISQIKCVLLRIQKKLSGVVNTLLFYKIYDNVPKNYPQHTCWSLFTGWRLCRRPLSTWLSDLMMDWESPGLAGLGDPGLCSEALLAIVVLLRPLSYKTDACFRCCSGWWNRIELDAVLRVLENLENAWGPSVTLWLHLESIMGFLRVSRRSCSSKRVH